LNLFFRPVQQIANIVTSGKKNIPDHMEMQPDHCIGCPGVAAGHQYSYQDSISATEAGGLSG
jgi:hypothetical protein